MTKISKNKKTLKHFAKNSHWKITPHTNEMETTQQHEKNDEKKQT